MPDIPTSSTPQTQQPPRKPAAAAPIANNSKRKARPPIPANESKEAKFVRLGTKRVNSFREQGRRICNLAAYPHSADQRARLMREVAQVAADIESAFSRRDKDRGAFSF